MQIANPICDVVFKYLLQNNELAILILSTILDEEIIALDLLSQKTSMALENRSFTVYSAGLFRPDQDPGRRGQAGRHRDPEGQVRGRHHALSPLSGEHYKQGFTLEPSSQVQQAIPIISLYFLGYRLSTCTGAGHPGA